ncbi:MAG: hypothetical protein DMD82_11880 [Candidatus Rokuibacteriota bacterium]|nr:MAG: hypothetical protein DMD82_11880 [Candidatus Rokubacteria bacterium]
MGAIAPSRVTRWAKICSNDPFRPSRHTMIAPPAPSGTIPVALLVPGSPQTTRPPVGQAGASDPSLVTRWARISPPG